MRLPRRVPWASIGELDQLCSWIFADDNDHDSKIIALNRLSAWKAITTLPHALESTLALLSVILQDRPPLSAASSLSLRHSYAATILRLVNGLVDPLQLGAYARSIASIAAQLGLPSWLVELRHAATHEDLPSLELLREAARESMSWLLHNYFLPILNPLTALPRPQSTIRPLAPLLKQYKTLLKMTIRDTSLRTRYDPAIKSVLREIERWMAEAKVAANLDSESEFGWGPDGWPSENGASDPRERWALDKLCDALLEKGVLVPIAKKKRIYPSNAFSPPKTSLLLWTPLLSQLQAHHPDLPSTLANRIVSHLLSDTLQLDISFDQDHWPDESFDMCLARWAWWIVDTWPVDDGDEDSDFKKDIILTLVTSLGPQSNHKPGDKKVAKALLRALCAGNSELEAALTILLPPKNNIPAHRWSEDDMSVIHQRLETLLSFDLDSRLPKSLPPPKPGVSTSNHSLPLGWQACDTDSGWKPCPVGVYVSVNSHAVQ